MPQLIHELIDDSVWRRPSALGQCAVLRELADLSVDAAP